MASLKKQAKRVKKLMKKEGIPRMEFEAGLIVRPEHLEDRLALYRDKFHHEPDYYTFLTDRKTHLYVILGPLRGIADGT